MREERLEVSVTFDERHGYIGSAPELRSPVVALSLGGLRRKIEIAMLPDDVDARLVLDRAALHRKGVTGAASPIGKRFSTRLPDCKYALSVAEPFDTQGFDIDPSSSRDIGKSPNLSRSRIGWHQHSSHAYGQDRGYPSVHLPKRWSVQQDRWHMQEVVSSQVFSFRNTPNIC
jgi:hypothetical protein